MRSRFLSRLTVILLLVAGFFAAGCAGPKSYLEPKYRGVTLAEITPPPAPIPVVLSVNGETNGKPVPKATDYWRGNILRVLSTSHVFTEAGSTQENPAHLRITINNIGDIRAAFTKGFGTSLTLGALGNTVTDGYVMTAEFEAPDGRKYTNEYHHAIYTTRGYEAPPVQVDPVALVQAPVLVTDDLVLHLLKDLHSSGYY